MNGHTPFSVVLRATDVMHICEHYGIVGGKHLLTGDSFALPGFMDGRPCIAMGSCTTLFPCDGTGSTDIRKLTHSSTPNCALVPVQFWGDVNSFSTLIAIKDTDAGETLTVNHDTDFKLCCCGKCSRSRCEVCQETAVLTPCPSCRMSYYCSPACRDSAAAPHISICASRCANMAVLGRVVLDQAL